MKTIKRLYFKDRKRPQSIVLTNLENMPEVGDVVNVNGLPRIIRKIVDEELIAAFTTQSGRLKQVR